MLHCATGRLADQPSGRRVSARGGRHITLWGRRPTDRSTVGCSAAGRHRGLLNGAVRLLSPESRPALEQDWLVPEPDVLPLVARDRSGDGVLSALPPVVRHQLPPAWRRRRPDNARRPIPASILLFH